MEVKVKQQKWRKICNGSRGSNKKTGFLLRESQTESYTRLVFTKLPTITYVAKLWIYFRWLLCKNIACCCTISRRQGPSRQPATTERHLLIKT